LFTFDVGSLLIPPCAPMPVVTIDGPYVWDVSQSDTITVQASISGRQDWCWMTGWDIEELANEHTSGVAGEHGVVYSWGDLQAAGAAPGVYTLTYTVADTCDFTTGSTTLTIVPEPASIGLLILGAITVLRRRAKA